MGCEGNAGTHGAPCGQGVTPRKLVEDHRFEDEDFVYRDLLS
jgi:hypothetical protein